jgi:hypothetical protein
MELRHPVAYRRVRDGWLGNDVRDGVEAPNVSDGSVEGRDTAGAAHVGRLQAFLADAEARYHPGHDGGEGSHWIVHLLEHDITAQTSSTTGAARHQTPASARLACPNAKSNGGRPRTLVIGRRIDRVGSRPIRRGSYGC